MSRMPSGPPSLSASCSSVDLAHRAVLPDSDAQQRTARDDVGVQRAVARERDAVDALQRLGLRRRRRAARAPRGSDRMRPFCVSAAYTVPSGADGHVVADRARRREGMPRLRRRRSQIEGDELGDLAGHRAAGTDSAPSTPTACATSRRRARRTPSAGRCGSSERTQAVAVAASGSARYMTPLMLPTISVPSRVDVTLSGNTSRSSIRTSPRGGR